MSQVTEADNCNPKDLTLKLLTGQHWVLSPNSDLLTGYERLLDPNQTWLALAINSSKPESLNIFDGLFSPRLWYQFQEVPNSLIGSIIPTSRLHPKVADENYGVLV